jgi:hypothetical protein
MPTYEYPVARPLLRDILFISDTFQFAHHEQQLCRLSPRRPKSARRAQASPKNRLLHLDILLSYVLLELPRCAFLGTD